MTDHLLVTSDDGVTTLTMNRPHVRNALSIEMRQSLIDTIDKVEHDPSVRCVVLTGAGGHFMAGGDIKSFAEFTKMEPNERRSYFEHRIHTIHPMLNAIRRMKKPVIASVQGAAAGAGMSFMMACDMAIASEDAVFSLAYVGIGTSPDGSGSFYLPRLVGLRKAMELAMLGSKIDANQALQHGLINWLVPTMDLEAETTKLVHKLANGPTEALGVIKNLMHASLGNGLDAQLAMEAEGFAQCSATNDWVEGVTAFNEKRRAQFKGN